MKRATVPILIGFLSCSWALGSTSETGLEEEIKNAEAEVAVLKEKREVLDQIESARKQLDDLRSQESSLFEEYQKAESEYQALEEARIRAKVAEEREKAVGESIATIKTKDGKVFENCTIRKITDVGITIRHSRGSSRIAAEDLPDEFQARFSFNEDEAIAQLKAERRMADPIGSMSRPPETSSSQEPGHGKPGNSNVSPPTAAEGGMEPEGWVTARVVAAKKDIEQKDIKQVEFRALANCPAKLTVRKTVNHPFVVAYQISENEEFATTVWMHSNYSARLYSASGELLGEETSAK